VSSALSDHTHTTSQKPKSTPAHIASTALDTSATAENIPAESAMTTAADATAEEEESSGGAFNPETGEINWDCPCLGGMAHGPCGQQFRDAFSCFVFSEEEPKGINCVEKFKAMQDCFREHPDVYGEGTSWSSRFSGIAF
jgi:mitochondrial intermembrane space import and assembly protein 40